MQDRPLIGTRSDLEAALKDWREEAKAQSGLVGAGVGGLPDADYLMKNIQTRVACRHAD